MYVPFYILHWREIVWITEKANRELNKQNHSMQDLKGVIFTVKMFFIYSKLRGKFSVVFALFCLGLQLIAPMVSVCHNM